MKAPWRRNKVTAPRLVCGFTLVESLVAISILLLAIAAPLTIASRGIQATRSAREKLTATYLAEEAVEYVRNVRDENIIKGESDWLKHLSPCDPPDGCKIDISKRPDTPDISHLSSCGGSCPPLQFDDTSGKYGYTAGPDTIFTRTVIVDETVVGKEAEINVSVSWSIGAISQTVTVREILFNWQ